MGNEFDHIVSTLDSEQFGVKDLRNVSSRILHHWNEQNLLIGSTSKKKEWRKFSFVELIWINVINELRSLGIPIPLIRKLKVSLCTPVSLAEMAASTVELLEQTQNDPSVTLKHFFKAQGASDENLEASESVLKDFESVLSELKNLQLRQLTLYILDFIENRIPINLLIFDDGSHTVWKNSSIVFFDQNQLTEFQSKTFVSISLTKILKRFMEEADPVNTLPSLKLLSENECYILDAISSSDYEKIEINFKNQKIESLHLTKSEDTKRKIIDILTENKYQDISITQHESRITKIKNTTKIKMKI